MLDGDWSSDVCSSDLYLSLDGGQAGRWDPAAKAWQELDDDYLASLKKGLCIAREISAPDTFVLPMPVAAGGAR
jgi:hypothetical protein